MGQFGVAAIGLPFRRGAHDHGDLPALAFPSAIFAHVECPFLIATLTTR
jgi:hypothetical protein